MREQTVFEIGTKEISLEKFLKKEIDDLFCLSQAFNTIVNVGNELEKVKKELLKAKKACKNAPKTKSSISSVAKCIVTQLHEQIQENQDLFIENAKILLRIEELVS